MQVRTNVNAAGNTHNRNHTPVRSLTVKTDVKAGQLKSKRQEVPSISN